MTTLNSLITAVRELGIEINKTARSMGRLKYVFRSRCGRKWTPMAPNGQNKKERKRNQVRLKGRGCKKH